MKKPRLREVPSFVWGHTAHFWQSWGLKPYWSYSKASALNHYTIGAFYIIKKEERKEGRRKRTRTQALPPWPRPSAPPLLVPM